MDATSAGSRGEQRLNGSIASLIAGSWATEQLFIALTWFSEDAKDLCRAACGAPVARAESEEKATEGLQPAEASAPAH